MTAVLARRMERPLEFAHTSVLLDEVLALAREASPTLIVDGTVGGAGHASALLTAHPAARLIGFDRDPTAVAVARERLAPFGARATVVHARFSTMATELSRLGSAGADFLLVDLGVSSHQLDTAARGFSFRHQGPLDMRMDPTAGEGAYELIARLSESDLADVIYDLGEERHSRRVARALKQASPSTTSELADVIRKVVPKSKDGIDPATRTFQALRIAVNDELGELSRWLADVPSLLRPGGVAAVISFHSLEDRLVKNAFRAAEKGCVCPKSLPACVCGKGPLLDVLTSKPIVASDAEVRSNARARSAKLRAARKLEDAR